MFVDWDTRLHIEKRQSSGRNDFIDLSESAHPTCLVLNDCGLFK